MDGLPVGVIPVLIGPLQVLLAILPGLLAAVFMALISLFKPRVMLQFLKLLWHLKFHIAGIIVCIFGIRWAVLKFRPQTSRAAGLTTATAAAADWTAFRGSAERTGATSATNEPSKGQVNWAVRKEERFYSSPAVVGNRVYASTAAGLSPFDKEGVGFIRCFDATTGAELWSTCPAFKSGAKSYRATFSSPVVKGNYLVCGEGLHVTKRCRVVCLDLTPGKEGNLLWSHETASHVECSPAIATVTWTENGKEMSEDRVYVGAGDNDGYYCFDLKTGAVRWHLDGKDFPDAETALAVRGNRVYAGQGNGGKSLCVIDAVTGKLIRRVLMPYPVFAPPAIANGKIYVGMGNGDFIYSAAALGLPPCGELWCLDLAKLEQDPAAPFEPDWKITVGETILGAIAVDSNTAWFCSADGWLYGADLNQKGRIRGKWNARDLVKSSPALTARFVYVMAESGMLHAINRETFEPVWSYKVGAKPLCISSPAIAGGRVYVGTEESGLVCAGEPAPPEKEVWQGHLGGPERAGNYFGSPPSDRGQFSWNWPASLDGSTPVAYLTAPCAAPGDRLLVPIAARVKNGPAPGIICIPAQSAKSDGPDRVIWKAETTNGVHLSPATVDTFAFFVDGVPGDFGRDLHCLDLRDGHSLWRRPVSTNASGVFMVTANTILIQNRPGTLNCMDTTGETVWSFPAAGLLSSAPAVYRQWVVVASVAPPALTLLDRVTGRVLWKVALRDPPVGSPVVSRTGISLATVRGMETHSLTDGKTLPVSDGSISGLAVSADPAATRAHFIYITPDGKLVVVDRKTGRPVVEPVPGAMPGTSPLPGGNTILYLRADGAILKVQLGETPTVAGPDLPRLKPGEWLADTAALGKPTTPMVLAGGNIYMGWTGWGLVCLGPAK